MTWHVEIHDDLAEEMKAYPVSVIQGLAALTTLLEQFGPELSRPHADTLNDSNHANMKELRFKADNGVWRFAFAFDPERAAIILVGGDKSGGNEKRFYRKLIRIADKRFDDHLEQFKTGKGR